MSDIGQSRFNPRNPDIADLVVYDSIKVDVGGKFYTAFFNTLFRPESNGTSLKILHEDELNVLSFTYQDRDGSELPVPPENVSWYILAGNGFVVPRDGMPAHFVANGDNPTPSTTILAVGRLFDSIRIHKTLTLKPTN